ncbi:4'-phosphopantetheinyl transferase family protein [Cryobacterium flavum]|uniref:4'-phosphopantetheinyl transferase family protein n=1 Tax=Cryobacterium flavum TaxID=1424659 RepID=UPI0013564DC8|nr:4'-phosphopantetheinyl transferase superfamily protein [Cryobacterium flavum]
MPQTFVSLLLQPRAPLPQTDRLLLAAAVARVCAVDLAAVTIEQRCEHCGGAHGRPRVLTPGGVHVSLSRAGRTVVVAVSQVGPIGVDLESVASVARAGFDDVAFNADERTALAELPVDERDRARAALWTTKEALLKLSGEGLTVDPREVTVALGPGGASALLSWPTATLDLSRVHVVGFDAGPGLVGTLALLGPRAPSLSML